MIGSDRWQLDAACAGVGPKVMWPDPRDHAGLNAARAICASCPVTVPCLAVELEGMVACRQVPHMRSGTAGTFPVVAGFTALERVRLLETHRTPVAAVAAVRVERRAAS